jgi:competence protein ComEC
VSAREPVRRLVDVAVAITTHPRHRLLFGLVAGLLLEPVSRAATVAAAAAAGAVVAAAAAVAAPPRTPTTVRPGAVLAVVLAVLAGGVLTSARLAALEGGVLPRVVGRTLDSRAVVLEPVRRRAFGGAVARARLLDGPARGEQAVLRMRAASIPGAWPEVGDIVAVAGSVERLGRFDAYQARRGALVALEVDRLSHTGTRRGGLPGALDGVRRRAERGLDRALAPAGAALMRGMVLGEDDRLDDDERTDFQRSGLAHVLAVSGQNVMLLATLVLGLGALAGVPLRARLVAALGLVALYVPLTGAGPSIQRAGVMGVAGLVAALSGRPSSRWYALGLAAAVTLALNPRTAGEPGWQLSFAAVIALLALGPPVREALGRRLPAPVAEAAAITVAATLGTAPLMAFHFDQVSLVSLPANLVAAPAVAPIMWLGMLAAAAAQVAPGLAMPFDVLAAPLLAFVAGVAHAAAGLPLAVTSTHLGSPIALGVAYGALTAATMLAVRAWRRAARDGSSRPGGLLLRRRPLVLAAVALACAGAFGVARARAGPATPPPGELVVSFLDIGQGDATLLQRNGASALVDTGPPDGPILQRVAAAGVRRLDALVLTHAQADHEGAALSVMRRFRPRLVLDGGAGWPTPVQRGLAEAARTAHSRLVAAHAGEALDLGGIRLRVLWPPPPPTDFRPDGDPNERAVVAIASAAGFDLLLTADAESDVTLPLELPHVEALKVAHHGSADEGLPLLLHRLTPAVAAIEVGRHNSYGHPAPATLAELRGVADVVRTDRDGTVRLHVRAGRMWLERLGPGR